MPRRLAVVVAALVALLLLAPTATAVAPAPRPLPPESQWRAAVHEVMDGGRAYLTRRAERAPRGARLAINLDIDNTMLATHYAEGRPIRAVRSFVRHARDLGMLVYVNTARRPDRRAETHAELARAGYDVDRICMRPRKGLARSKATCRARLHDAGFTIVANLGNRPTDFELNRGRAAYERAFRLPHYGKQLG
ncbi:HAD family acid phosphatase [Nocardioides marinquilinus]|uniref:HAD family acid phosphatase n=1 Tax=Nocardioides marinquilinus TaxID=1210400 RepID=A0ABP9PBB9_9ACTN